MSAEKIVEIWDLDHTLLNTERQLWGPVLDFLSRLVGWPRAEIDRVFDQLNQTTFTFERMFEAIGVSRSRWGETEQTIRADVAARAEGCLYPGVVELLRDRKHVARQVLVTGGDPEYQRWKFSALPSLHGIFAEDDRHFVPMSGSKGDVVARYVGAAVRLRFIDDSARWHLDVIQKTNGKVQHIRPIWPDTLGAKDHTDDGRLWQTARSADDLRRLLNTDA
jgi:hypothetical protein